MYTTKLERLCKEHGVFVNPWMREHFPSVVKHDQIIRGAAFYTYWHGVIRRNKHVEAWNLIPCYWCGSHKPFVRGICPDCNNGRSKSKNVDYRKEG